MARRQSLRVVLGKQESTVGAPAFLSKPGSPLCGRLSCSGAAVPGLLHAVYTRSQ